MWHTQSAEELWAVIRIACNWWCGFSWSRGMSFTGKGRAHTSSIPSPLYCVVMGNSVNGTRGCRKYIRVDGWPSSILSSPVTRTHREEIKIARWNRSEWEFISAIDRSVDRDMSMQTNPMASHQLDRHLIGWRSSWSSIKMESQSQGDYFNRSVVVKKRRIEFIITAENVVEKHSSNDSKSCGSWSSAAASRVTRPFKNPLTTV